MITQKNTQGFSSSEQQKLTEALEVANKVLETDGFKNLVQAYKFTTTNDNGIEVFQRLTNQDWAIPFAIESYSRWQFWKWREVANEDQNGLVTFNRKFFASQSVASIVNTIIHELCHVAGYSHASAHDYDSVPYACGDIAEQVASGMPGYDGSNE